MQVSSELSTGDSLMRIGGIVAIILGGIIVTALILPIIQAFRSDLKYINMEIKRTDGREQAHWKRRKREMWLSLIPFYRPRSHRRHDQEKQKHHHHHHHHRSDDIL